MHVIFRETHGMEEIAIPQDLGQSPADLVVLSFSDSDLGAFAGGWHKARAQDADFPTLRLANIASLQHPLSVDTYIQRTLTGAKAILIRLIGGVAYWPYGLQQVELLARNQGIALAVLPGDGRPDDRLAQASTLPPAILHDLAAMCDAGGADGAYAALTVLAGAAGLTDRRVEPFEPLPTVGAWHPARGLCDPAACDFDKPLVVIIFYRSYLVADDLDPFIALHAGFEAKGYAALSLFAPSLKEPVGRAQIEAWLRQLSPVAIVNATGFSALDEHGHSPLDIAGSPVFQIALATSGQEAWAEGARGLSPADLAMHVVLPEIDGRVFMGVASFKAGDPRDAALGFARNRHLSQSDRVAAIVEKVSGWIALAAKSVAERRVALVLSTYPGRPEAMAHAVGLDALSSTQAILADMAQAGYCVTPGHDLAMALQAQTLSWRLADYRRALVDLPAPLQQTIHDCWGAPEDDPAVIDGVFRFPAINLGHAMVALQPERGERAARDGDYHDLSRHPRHAYVAFYLWLRAQGFDAMVHIGAHGTLEWLPGKAVALSDQCWPEVLTAGLPVIYPFIVNDPGEAAQAKRRIGAVTIGHVPPPMGTSAQGAGLGRIEALLDVPRMTP